MPTDLTTPPATPESDKPSPDAAPEDESESLSGVPAEVLQDVDETELPEEYKPYSQFPWDKVPEDARPDLLKAVKKFHGDMSRGSQEAATLRQRLPELEQKAMTLERLSSDPEFQAWWNGRGSPPAPRETPAAAPSKLAENFGPEVVQELGQLMSRLIDERVGPVKQQLDYQARVAVEQQTSKDVQTLAAKAQENGWPAVNSHIDRMTDLVRQGRARTPEDAYFLSCREEILGAERKRGASEKLAALRAKAGISFPPAQGRPAAGEAQVTTFTGNDAIANAMEATAREMGYKFGG